MRRLAAALLAASATAAAAADVDLPAQDRQALDVTIYTNGLALIRDSRKATVAAGSNRLAFPDVSRQMIPESAIVSGEGLTVNALDYEAPTLSADALIRRHVGREVGVVRVNPSAGGETVERATILSAEAGVVLRYRDRIETGVPGRLVFDTVPEGLHPTSTLVATVHADDASERAILATSPPGSTGRPTMSRRWATAARASPSPGGSSSATPRAPITPTPGSGWSRARSTG